MRKSAFVWLLFGLFSVQTSPGFAQSTQNGAVIYQRYCISCHGVGGRSMLPDVPNLYGRQGSLAPDVALMEKLKKGSQRKPPFIGLLSDRDMLDVLAYIRTFY